MKRNIYKASNYIWDHISSLLEKDTPVFLPRELIDKEGVSVDELSEYFFLQTDGYDLIKILGHRQAI